MKQSQGRVREESLPCKSGLGFILNGEKHSAGTWARIGHRMMPHDLKRARFDCIVTYVDCMIAGESGPYYRINYCHK